MLSNKKNKNIKTVMSKYWENYMIQRILHFYRMFFSHWSLTLQCCNSILTPLLLISMCSEMCASNHLYGSSLPAFHVPWIDFWMLLSFSNISFWSLNDLIFCFAGDLTEWLHLSPAGSVLHSCHVRMSEREEIENILLKEHYSIIVSGNLA